MAKTVENIFRNTTFHLQKTLHPLIINFALDTKGSGHSRTVEQIAIVSNSCNKSLWVPRTKLNKETAALERSKSTFETLFDKK